MESKTSADPAGPLVAQVFKTRIDPFVQKLSFIRIYSGSLKRDDQVTVSTARKPVKLGQPLRVQASETQPLDVAGPGDIIAIAKMEDLTTNASLGDYRLPLMSLSDSDGRPGRQSEEPRRRNEAVRRDP